jgi:hypothetical protein
MSAIRSRPCLERKAGKIPDLILARCQFINFSSTACHRGAEMAWGDRLNSLGEGVTLDSEQLDGVEVAGRRSRAKRGVEDPGRRAGSQIPDKVRDRRFRTKSGRASGRGPRRVP